MNDALARPPADTAGPTAPSALAETERLAALARAEAARAATLDLSGRSKIEVQGLSLRYGQKQALTDIDLTIAEGEVTAFIGPSGCGKTTLLRCLNRMHETNTDVTIDGAVMLRGEDGALENVYGPEVDPPFLRRRFGWVAQKPDPFPDSVYDNVAYGPHLQGAVEDGPEMADHVRAMLQRATLWEELEDRLEESGVDLSIGQQQRLCIARALSGGPETLLMDEPCGSLDPISTRRIEELILSLKGEVTIVLVTHNMEQAARVADRVAFFDMGRVRVFGRTEEVFAAPDDPRLAAYLSGRFG